MAEDIEGILTMQHPNPLGGNTNRRIVIVGAGPAGIHMACQLIRLGYKNVVILEKDKFERGVYGKTYTHFDEESGDCPLE